MQWRQSHPAVQTTSQASEFQWSNWTCVTSINFSSQVSFDAWLRSSETYGCPRFFTGFRLPEASTSLSHANKKQCCQLEKKTWRSAGFLKRMKNKLSECNNLWTKCSTIKLELCSSTSVPTLASYHTSKAHPLVWLLRLNYVECFQRHLRRPNGPLQCPAIHYCPIPRTSLGPLEPP